MFRIFAIALLLVGCASGPNEQKVSFNPKAAEANAELGKNYMQRGDYEIALGKFKKAISYNSKSVNSHHYIAELYRRLNQPDKADEHFNLAIEYSSNDSALHNNYGVYLCGEQRLDDAMVQFDKVLKNPVYRFPEHVYENIGLCLVQNSQLELAEKNLRKALTINPKLVTSLFEMAKISFQREKYFSARAFSNRYAEIGEPSPESLWLAIEIETKLNDPAAVKNHGKLLVEKFPLSEEADAYHQLNKR